MSSAVSYPNAVFTGIRLIIFDLDGTLVDAFADITAAVNYMLSKSNLPPRSIDEVKKHVGNGATALVAGVLATDDAATIEENHRHLVEYYHQHSSAHATLYDRVVETLQLLRERGFKLALVSNKPDLLTQKVTRDLEVHHLFEMVAGESPRFPRKPSPEIITHIMDQFGATADNTIVVGDSCVDIDFARAAGLPVVAVSYGQTTFEDLCTHKPDAIIHSIADLAHLLQ